MIAYHHDSWSKLLSQLQVGQWQTHPAVSVSSDSYQDSVVLTMLPNEIINVIGVVRLLGPTQVASGSVKTLEKEIVSAGLEATWSVAVTLWGENAK
jgi:hypothetical protein